MSEPSPEIVDPATGLTSANLVEILASLQRRVRLLEQAPPTPRPIITVPVAASGPWIDTLKRNSWSCVYVFIGLVDVAFALKTHDWLLLFGGAAMFAFAWLSWRPE